MRRYIIIVDVFDKFTTDHAPKPYVHEVFELC